MSKTATDHLIEEIYHIKFPEVNGITSKVFRIRISFEDLNSNSSPIYSAWAFITFSPTISSFGKSIEETLKNLKEQIFIVHNIREEEEEEIYIIGRWEPTIEVYTYIKDVEYYPSSGSLMFSWTFQRSKAQTFTKKQLPSESDLKKYDLHKMKKICFYIRL